MTKAFLDTDILYKAIMYGLGNQLLNLKTRSVDSFHILGAAKFMILKKLNKRPPTRGLECSLHDFEILLTQLNELEPTDEEIKLASQFEYTATQNNLPLDAGESLLCAALLIRGLNYIFTGDKRAVIAVSKLPSPFSTKEFEGKFVCLEQLFKDLLTEVEPLEVRSIVCAEKSMDKALTNCFLCSSPHPQTQDFQEGLESYINDLRSNAPKMLAD